jgi:hypothetical protein
MRPRGETSMPLHCAHSRMAWFVLNSQALLAGAAVLRLRVANPIDRNTIELLSGLPPHRTVPG